jgi:hypothetical protein
MNNQKLVLILIILVSIGLIGCTILFNWNPLNFWPGAHAVFRPSQSISESRYIPPISISILAALFSFYLTGILALFLIPAQILQMSKSFRTVKESLRLGLLGILVGILLITIIISSAMAMGTFPLTFLLGSLLFLSIFTGVITLAFSIGRYLLHFAGLKGTSPFYTLALGELVIYSLVNLPWIGVISLVFFCSLGLGVVIASRLGTNKSWSINLLTEEDKE